MIEITYDSIIVQRKNKSNLGESARGGRARLRFYTPRRPERGERSGARLQGASLKKQPQYFKKS